MLSSPIRAVLLGLVAAAEPHEHPFTSPEALGSHSFRDATPSQRVTKARIATARGKDVLMIVIDDLRAQLACSEQRGFAKPAMYTPHLCGLARKSLMMQRSHVAMATCGPSRASILTGRHPSTTRVWDTKSYWRNVSGNFTTIPQYFKEQGYMTVGMGKIFHGGEASGAVPQPPSCQNMWSCRNQCLACRGTNDGNYSWTEPYFTPQKSIRGHGHAWLAVDDDDSEPLEDVQTRDNAVAILEGIAANRLARKDERAFFVAVGFRKPHLPFVFPKRFLDFYPPIEETELPTNPSAPEGMPRIAWSTYPEVRHYDDVKVLRLNGKPEKADRMPNRKARELRRAYYAAVSFADSNVGHVLTTLGKSGLEDNTVVVVFSDHGWSLGEHGLWAKHTNFDLNTRAPLIIHVPGVTDGGINTNMITSHLDIFPTVVDLVFGLEMPQCGQGPGSSYHTNLCTEGTSLVPLIRHPERPVKVAAYSVYTRDVPGADDLADELRSTEQLTYSDVATSFQDRWSGGGGQHGGGQHALQHGGGQHGGSGHGGSRHGGNHRQSEDARVIDSGEGEHSGPPSPCLDHGRTGAGCVMGYSMQTRHAGHEFRFTEWVHFSGPNTDWKPNWNVSYGIELYNHSCDEEENNNRYPLIKRAAPRLAEVLRGRLHTGWKQNFIEQAT